MKRLKTWAAALGLLAVATATHAASMVSVDADLGMLVSATGLAWTANMNLDGRMTWAHANAWIGTLNASNYAGHNDWRLPTLNPSDIRGAPSFGGPHSRHVQLQFMAVC